jgi:hypothetical protein
VGAGARPPPALERHIVAPGLGIPDPAHQPQLALVEGLDEVAIARRQIVAHQRRDAVEVADHALDGCALDLAALRIGAGGLGRGAGEASLRADRRAGELALGRDAAGFRGGDPEIERQRDDHGAEQREEHAGPDPREVDRDAARQLDPAGAGLDLGQGEEQAEAEIDREQAAADREQALERPHQGGEHDQVHGITVPSARRAQLPP